MNAVLINERLKFAVGVTVPDAIRSDWYDCTCQGEKFRARLTRNKRVLDRHKGVEAQIKIHSNGWITRFDISHNLPIYNK